MKIEENRDKDVLKIDGLTNFNPHIYSNAAKPFVGIGTDRDMLE